ncbi:Zinc finger protein 112 [Blattella germanica]|nr:Zinc finger protein 112 [Blattella germanica]
MDIQIKIEPEDNYNSEFISSFKIKADVDFNKGIGSIEPIFVNELIEPEDNYNSEFISSFKIEADVDFNKGIGSIEPIFANELSRNEVKLFYFSILY